jgi:hypothetical protein
VGSEQMMIMGHEGVMVSGEIEIGEIKRLKFSIH